MDVINSLIPLSEVPKKRPAKLEIVTPNLGLTKQQVTDQWIKNKTTQIRINQTNQIRTNQMRIITPSESRPVILNIQSPQQLK